MVSLRKEIPDLIGFVWLYRWRSLTWITVLQHVFTFLWAMTYPTMPEGVSVVAPSLSLWFIWWVISFGDFDSRTGSLFKEPDGGKLRQSILGYSTSVPTRQPREKNVAHRLRIIHLIVFIMAACGFALNTPLAFLTHRLW